MKLSFEQIQKITKGAARIERDEGKIKFYRFTEEQEKLYLEDKLYSEPDKAFYKKTFATAGIRLEFKTNSKTLSLKVDVSPASSRTFFSHDISVNGEVKYSLASNLASTPDGHMTIEGSYALGDGEKLICIYFPWSVASELLSLDLDNGSTIIPVEHSRRMIMFGDSITHGYDAAKPSEAYSSLLTDALDAEARNKGIGGEIFQPELAATSERFVPDIITVAYGTNDWGKLTSKEEFDARAEAFYKNLAKCYPEAKIFALAPIWRGNVGITTKVGKFEYIAEKLKDISEEILNMRVINCIDFVPHNPEMFSPDVLHPNFLGFSHYTDNLIKEIKKYL